jgi:hypothetical protein
MVPDASRGRDPMANWESIRTPTFANDFVHIPIWQIDRLEG